jgi:hypothetical protein
LSKQEPIFFRPAPSSQIPTDLIVDTDIDPSNPRLYLRKGNLERDEAAANICKPV